MSKNCIGKLYMGDKTVDSLQNIELTVDDSLDLDLVIETLIKDKNSLNKIQQLLDHNNYRRPTYDKLFEVKGQYDFTKGIPVGTSNMKNLVDKVRSIPQFMVTALEESGFNMEANNIILDDSMVYKNKESGKKYPVVRIQNFEIEKTDANGNIIKEQDERVILPNNSDAITNYIKYRYLMTKKDSDTLKSIVSSVLSEEFINLIGNENTQKSLNKVAKDANKVQLFLQWYYSDAIFHSVMDNATDNALPKVLESFMYSQDTDVHIEGLGTLSKGVIDVSEVSNTLKQEGISSDPMLYIRQKVYEHNSLYTNNQYSLRYNGDNKMKLIPSTYQESLKQTRVNTRFYSPVVPVYEKYKGFYIYKHGNKFYTSEILVDNLESFLQLIETPRASQYNSLSYAKQGIVKTYGKSKTFSQSATEIRLILSKNKIINHKNDPINRYIIEVPDIDLDGTFTPSYEHALLTQQGHTVASVIYTLENNRQQYGIPAQYDLNEVFDSFTNVNIFLYQASKIWATSDNREADIEKLLDKIKNASHTAYRVGEKNEKQYKYDIIETSEQVSQSSVKPFKNELIYTIENLEKHFGIEIKKINNADILSGAYKNIPNIRTAKAFILNGVIHVNVDKASNQDLIHEYGHLMLAMIKNHNIETYLNIVKTVREHPDYLIKVDSYRKYSDARALSDIEEEIIVDMFGLHLGKGMEQAFSKDIQKGYLQAVRSVFGLRDNVSIYNISEINQLTLEDAINLMGSILLSENNPFSSQEAVNQTIVPRKVANIIGKMMDSGELIESNC